MNFGRIAASLLLSTGLATQAAVIESTYSSLGGGQWSAEFNVLGDGSPAQIGEFTIFFPQALFSNLSLAATPSTWDSLVIDGDPGIPADGFLDAFAIDPVDALSVGESRDGFTVKFSFIGQGSPGSLPFDIIDANFQILFSGRTIVTGVAPGQVPEPGTFWLFGLGLIGAGVARRLTTERQSCASPAGS